MERSGEWSLIGFCRRSAQCRNRNLLGRSPRAACPTAQAEGLYDPANEHDACGVGFVVNIKGERSHDLLRSGLEILVNLSHRGACGCDPLTGDGCGVLTQMPDELLRAKTAEIGFELPPRGEYGAGAVFLPPDTAQREFCERRLEAIIADEGQKFLGWRDVPVNTGALGWLAQSVEPTIRQLFIARGADTPADMFEWKLYVIRGGSRTRFARAT